MARSSRAGKTGSARTTASEKSLRREVAKLRGKLDKTEEKRQQWKQRAKDHHAAATTANKRAAKLQRKLEKASSSMRKTVSDVVEPVSTELAEIADTSSPDESWTLTRLRAEARSKGVVGYSRMSKARLISALS